MYLKVILKDSVDGLIRYEVLGRVLFEVVEVQRGSLRWGLTRRRSPIVRCVVVHDAGGVPLLSFLLLLCKGLASCSLPGPKI